MKVTDEEIRAEIAAVKKHADSYLDNHAQNLKEAIDRIHKLENEVKNLKAALAEKS